MFCNQYTHSRESIDALRQLMGHVSIETTAGYLHPVVAKATNPLDDLIAVEIRDRSKNEERIINLSLVPTSPRNWRPTTGSIFPRPGGTSVTCRA